MDTEKMYFPNGELDGITFSKLSESELETCKNYVEITRHLQEIHQLFLIFKYNIDFLQNQYVLIASGDVFHNQKPAVNEEDYIAVNAHTTNIISAGRTLVESMECYIKDKFSSNDAIRNQYLNYYHDTYDTSFAYRLLIRLRDFSQHGHLTVCKTQNNYYFDLKQIIDKPHYNHNKALEQEMKSIVDEIITVYRDTPTLSFTRTIAEFVAKLFSIYKEFLMAVEDCLKKSCVSFQNIVQLRPENIITNESAFAGCFIYEFEAGMLQAVPINDNPEEMFGKLKKEAELIYNEYMDAYQNLVKNTIQISVDNEHIEVSFT